MNTRAAGSKWLAGTAGTAHVYEFRGMWTAIPGHVLAFRDRGLPLPERAK